MSIVKKISIFLTVLILLLSWCFSCKFTKKESIQTDALQIDYYVRYLQSGKQLKAEISFAEVDSIQKIMPKKMSEVLFQNLALDGKKLPKKYRYELTTETVEKEHYSFTYRLDSRLSSTQEIIITPIADFSIKKDKVSLNAGTKVKVMGKPLQENESIILLISDENNKTSTLKIDTLSTNKEIVVQPEQLNSLKLGKGTIYLVRRQITKEKSNHVQLTGLTEYYTTAKNIEIIQ